MKYLYNLHKESSKVHIEGSDGRSLCAVENCGVFFETSHEKKHPDKKMCGICRSRNSKGKTKGKSPKKIASKKKAEKFYQSFGWRQARYKAIKKNDGRCECCGRSKNEGIYLCVDHIKALRKFWYLRKDPNNLQVLCNECNHGKGAWDQTDWREPSLRKLMSEET